jgi:glycosyltransferase involved in cell wall biosynthesis
VKALYIVTAYDRRPGDGITPWLVETIRRLGHRGVEVEVLAPAYRGLESGRVDGVMVHRFRYAPTSLEDLTHDQTAPDRVRERPAYLALVPGYLLSASRKARALARSGEFDLVHAHWPLPHAIPGQAARKAAGIPLVLTFHGVEMTFARNTHIPLLVPFLRRAVRGADAVTANSSYTAGLIRELHTREVDIIPFGSTVDAPASSSGSRSGMGPTRLLFVGRLVERKGAHHLIDAIALLRNDLDIRASIVGEGPLREALEARAREAGISDVVEFTGFVDADRLAHEYATCDVFVLPAAPDAKGDVEGLGVVLIEALAHGRPAVASAVGGIVDIVRDGETGLLVPPGDPDALAAALSRLARDPELSRRLGEGGRAHVAARFAWPAITDQLVGLYRRVISTRSAGSRP